MRFVRTASPTLAALLAAACTTGGTTDPGPTPPKTLRILDFQISQMVVAPGATVSLSYAVENATSVTVSAAPGGVLVDGATAQAGVATSAAITEATTFTLRALGENMQMAERMLNVSVDTSSVAILEFRADPNPGAVGGMTTLSWRTTGADEIKLSEGPNKLLESTTMVAAGSLGTMLTRTMTTFTLEAKRGAMVVSRDITVTAREIPVIGNFTVSPMSFETAPVTVTIEWAVTNADTVRLEANGAPVMAFPGTLGGRITQEISTTTRYALVASNAAGAVRRERTVSGVVDEVEPNDTRANANDVSGGVVNASLSSATDVDWYQFVVPAGGSVFAQTSDGRTGCNVPNGMQLFGSDGTTEIIRQAGGGPEPGCSEIDPATNTAARNLAGGTYFLRIAATSSVAGRYTLTVRAEPATCGNGFIETANMEQCDDGNTMSGDGCNAMCVVEGSRRLRGPPGMMTFSDSLPVAGERDSFIIELTGPASIRAHVWAPTRGQCMFPGEIIGMELTQAGGMMPIGQGNSTGRDRCSHIEPSRDLWARLAPGNYVITVFAADPAITVMDYQLEVEIVPPGCGNGIPETGEACDDGNRMDGDGCNMNCQFEGRAESEPNNTSATADDAGSLPTILSGRIDPMDDVDYFAFDITAGQNLEAYLTANSLTQCSAMANVTLALYGPDGSTELATDSFGGPDNRCGRIAPNTTMAARGMAAGRYFLAVSTRDFPTTVAAYFLHLRTSAVGCGNSVLDMGEQCDDGNRSDNDGCSSMCRYEIARTLNAPGGFHQYNFTPPNRFFVVQVNVDRNGQSVEAITSDGAGACPLDTRLRMLDAQFNEIGRAENGPIIPCAGFDLLFDFFARDMAMGTYYVVLENDDIMGGTVELDIQIRDPICGDGWTQTRANEQCDDMNRTNGDGCSDMCRFEGDVTVEMEPNNTRMTANDSGISATTSSVTIAASIFPYEDEDWFQVTIPAGPNRRLIARTMFNPTDPSSCGGDTHMFLYDAQGTQLAENNDGNGICSLIDGMTIPAAGNLAPGTYYLKVEAFMDFEQIQRYFLTIEIR